MWNQAVKESEQKMKKATQVTHDELNRIRTGRANPALLDTIRVNYYNTPTPLKQLAAISAPEPRLMIVQPYDGGIAQEIVKTIQEADMGLVPQLDGKIVRIPIPPLSKERREELVKIVKKVSEDGRVSVRNVRRDANDQIKKLEKEKKITEDESKKALDEIQKITDRHIKLLDDQAESKEKDLLSS